MTKTLIDGFESGHAKTEVRLWATRFEQYENGVSPPFSHSQPLHTAGCRPGTDTYTQ